MNHHSPPLRIGSVCTGYGGLDEAVRQVFGGELAWVSDVDPGACQIIRHRMPGVPNLGDLRFVHWLRTLQQLGPIDIFCGGYPCQPFSLAGDLKGTQDVRHLWPWIARALGVLRPRIAIFENVANHLRVGFDSVLVDLAQLGFDAEWVVVRADEVGAPHQRKRLFLLAVAADAPNVGHERRGGARDGRARPADHRDPAADAHRSERERQPQERAGANAPSGHLRPAADAARLGHGDTGPAGVGGIPTAPVRGGSAALPDADGSRRGPHQHDVRPRQSDADWGRFAPAITRWEAATGRRAPWATDDRGRLAPQFVEWMMGLDPGWVTGVPDLTRSQQLKALGNGVVPQQAAAAIRLLADRAGVAA